MPGFAFNQPKRLIHESGALLFYGSADPDQPVVLEVSGDVCETHALDFINHGFNLGGRCTRFDVAADLGPDELALKRWSSLYRSFRRGRCETRIPRDSCHVLRSHREGDGSTAYYGSRQSEMMMRVYTKRGPLRLEVEVKPTSPAKRLAWAERLNRYAAGDVWRHFGHKISWPAAFYQELLEGAVAEVPAIVEEARTLNALLEAFRVQHGPTLWMLDKLGVPMADLTRPPSNPNGQWKSDMMRMSREGDLVGLDGARLRSAAEIVARRRVRTVV